MLTEWGLDTLLWTWLSGFVDPPNLADTGVFYRVSLRLSLGDVPLMLC